MTFSDLEFVTLSMAIGRNQFEAPTLSKKEKEKRKKKKIYIYSIAQCFSTAFASGCRFYIDPTLYGTKIICLYKSKDSLKSSTRVLNVTMYCIDCT